MVYLKWVLALLLLACSIGWSSTEERQLYSEPVVQASKSPSEPFLDYDAMAANTPLKRQLLESTELLAQLFLANSLHKDMNQVRWKNEFMPRHQFQQFLDQTQENHYKLQALQHGISEVEHNGTPTSFEIKFLLDELERLLEIVKAYEERVFLHELHYETLQAEVQDTMQEKLKYREDEISLQNFRKALENRFRVITQKFDMYWSYSQTSQPILRALEVFKASYNILVMQVALPKVDLYNEMKENQERFFPLTLFQKKKPQPIKAALFPKFLDTFYLEFEVNQPGKVQFLYLEGRLESFENQLKNLRGNLYRPVETALVFNNGLQESAFYYSRLRDIPITTVIQDIEDREALLTYKKVVDQFQGQPRNIPEFTRIARKNVLESKFSLFDKTFACKNYFK